MVMRPPPARYHPTVIDDEGEAKRTVNSGSNGQRPQSRHEEGNGPYSIFDGLPR